MHLWDISNFKMSSRTHPLQAELPSPLSCVDESVARFFVGWEESADSEFVDTRLTPLPTTPRCVTPAAPFVCAVETVGESNPPLLLAEPICEEFNTAGSGGAIFSTFAFAAPIPRISERIDFGFEASCCRSSSCTNTKYWLDFSVSLSQLLAEVIIKTRLLF